MNLLPPQILQKRQQMNLYKKMAAIQAVIFLLSILIVTSLSLASRIQEAQILEFNTRVQDSRFQESESIAKALQENFTTNENDSFDTLNLAYFDVTRLKKLEETLPSGVQLIQFDTDAETATILAQTYNLSLADIHRDAWIATGLVYQTRLVSATSFEDGRIQYVLSIIWCEFNLPIKIYED